MKSVKGFILNWLTSVFGAVAGVPLIIDGLTSIPRDWTKVITGVGAFLVGLFAKDSSITGVPK